MRKIWSVFCLKYFSTYSRERQIYLPVIPRVTDVERMKNGTPCNLPCKSLYHALLHLDPICRYSLNRRFARCTSSLTIMLNVGSAGFRTRINLLSRGFLAGRAGIPSPLDSSYVPPREIIYRWYVGIESRCTLIRFFQCDRMDLNFQFSLIGNAGWILSAFSFFGIVCLLSLFRLLHARGGRNSSPPPPFNLESHLKLSPQFVKMLIQHSRVTIKYRKRAFQTYRKY